MFKSNNVVSKPCVKFSNALYTETLLFLPKNAPPIFQENISTFDFMGIVRFYVW